MLKLVNASLNDFKYDVKVKKYCSNEGNILLASLDSITYQNNTRFVNFIKENNLNFKPYEEFDKTQIEERVNLVKSMTCLIWNVNDLK